LSKCCRPWCLTLSYQNQSIPIRSNQNQCYQSPSRLNPFQSLSNLSLSQSNQNPLNQNRHSVLPVWLA
jgi:hypothetical protein